MKVTARPVAAAASSAVSFIAGAVLPGAAAVFTPSCARIWVLVGAALVALAVAGVASARLGGMPVRRSVLRVIVAGAAALAFTYGVGGLT